MFYISTYEAGLKAVDPLRLVIILQAFMGMFFVDTKWTQSGLLRNQSGCLVRAADSTRSWNVVFLEEETLKGLRFDSPLRFLSALREAISLAQRQ